MKNVNFSRDFEVCFEFESWKAICCLGFKMATKFGRAAPTDGAKMRLARALQQLKLTFIFLSEKSFKVY